MRAGGYENCVPLQFFWQWPGHLDLWKRDNGANLSQRDFHLSGCDILGQRTSKRDKLCFDLLSYSEPTEQLGQIAAGCVTFGSYLVIGFGRVSP